MDVSCSPRVQSACQHLGAPTSRDRRPVTRAATEEGGLPRAAARNHHDAPEDGGTPQRDVPRVCQEAWTAARAASVEGPETAMLSTASGPGWCMNVFVGGPQQARQRLPEHEVPLSTIEGRWSLVMRRSHPLTRRTELALPDLTGEPLVFLEHAVNPPMHAWLLGRFAEAKLTPRIVYATTQPQVGVDLVREGMGAFFVPSYVLRSLPHGLGMRPFADLPRCRSVPPGAVITGHRR